jgi:hypothetical protein
LRKIRKLLGKILGCKDSRPHSENASPNSEGKVKAEEEEKQQF